MEKLHEAKMQNGSLHYMALALYRGMRVISEKVHALGSIPWASAIPDSSSDKLHNLQPLLTLSSCLGCTH